MAFKHILFVEMGGQGWQEAYYTSTSGDELPMSYGIGRTENLAQARAQLLSGAATIQGARTSRTEQKRISSLSRKAASLMGIEGSAGRRDQTTTSIAYRLATADYRYGGTHHLRGCPDDFISYSTPGKVQLSGQFGDLYPAWAQALAGQIVPFSGSPFALRAILKPPVENVPQVISSITVSATGLTVVEAVFPEGKKPSQEVETCRIAKSTFSGDNQLTYLLLNGVHRISKPDALGLGANQYVIHDVTLPAGTVPYLHDGTIALRRVGYVPIAHVDDPHPSSHDTGRPMLLRHGRRSVRR